MDWEIYYEGGATFSDLDGRPEDAPGYGLLCIWQANGDACFNSDHYIYRTDYGQWIDVDYAGLIDHMVEAAAMIVAYKSGRRVPLREWKRVTRRMNEAHDGDC